MRETTLSSHYIHRGRIVTLREDTVRLSSGVVAQREIVEHHRAVVVLPVRPNGDILLVRQYRTAAQSVLLEVPAGLLHVDETPEAGAHRELREETGLTQAVLSPLFEGYPTPGFCTEYMYFFVAQGGVFGSTDLDPDEVVETLYVSLPDAVSAVREGRIVDIKTIAALGWYSAFYA